MNLRDEIAQVCYSTYHPYGHSDGEKEVYQKADDILALVRKALTSDGAVEEANVEARINRHESHIVSMRRCIAAALDAVTGETPNE